MDRYIRIGVGVGLGTVGVCLIGANAGGWVVLGVVLMLWGDKV